jgi:aconitate hydratase
MLPLVFSDPADYDKIGPNDRIDLKITQLAVGKPMTLVVHPADGGKAFDISLSHTFNEGQIEWFKNGSAHNNTGIVDTGRYTPAHVTKMETTRLTGSWGG